MMKKFNNLFKSESGFTLVELLVVIAVLAILAGVAVPKLTGVRDRAYEAEAQHALDAFKTGVQLYEAEHGNYPENEMVFHNDVADLYVVQFDSGTYENWNVHYCGVDSDGNPDLEASPSGENFSIGLSSIINKNIIRIMLTHTEDGFGEVTTERTPSSES